MKCMCHRETLLVAFQTAATVVPSRTPKPILKNVRIDMTTEGGLVTATDMEVGIRIEVPTVEVEVPGSFIAPVGLFGSILRESSDTKLAIEAGSQGTRVTGEHCEFKMPFQNPDEFPAVAAFQETSYHEVSAGLLRELIRRTAFATDQENSRYALGGVLLELQDERVIGVATDGRRLAKMEGPARVVEGHSNVNAMTIVPTRAMTLLEKALVNPEADVQIAARPNDILVRGGPATIFARLVEGRFPRWRDVLPERPEATRVEINVGPLYSALRQAAIFTDSESRGIDFMFGNGILLLKASVANSGDSRVELPISYTGQPVTLALDNRYVGDFLRVLDPQQNIAIDFVDSESAALFTTTDGYGYVIMPMAREG
ncbi:MAG: DNA polymerase III subunit beta [Pirellulaceae bacterium]